MLEGFEEVEIKEFKEVEEEKDQKKKGNRPNFRVVQPVYENGKTVYKNVGAMWKSVSKNGNEFYVLKIGELRLLVFPNE